ncbi:unnamed protein product [Closterium sp. NIES-53]
MALCARAATATSAAAEGGRSANGGGLDSRAAADVALLWAAVDGFKEAVVLTRERHVDMEAYALSWLGHVYDVALQMDDISHRYHQRAVQWRPPGSPFNCVPCTGGKPMSLTCPSALPHLPPSSTARALGSEIPPHPRSLPLVFRLRTSNRPPPGQGAAAGGAAARAGARTSAGKAETGA